MEKKLKLLLFACLGLGITTLALAEISTTIIVPSKPGIPLAIELWETGCLIKYKVPQNDGGAPITNYHIEHRGNWELSWKFRGISQTTEYQFKDMKENTKAQFRVSASNSAGVSTPSGTSSFITFRGGY